MVGWKVFRYYMYQRENSSFLREINAAPFSMYEMFLSTNILLQILLQDQIHLWENTSQAAKCQNMEHKYLS